MDINEFEKEMELWRHDVIEWLKTLEPEELGWLINTALIQRHVREEVIN